MAREDSLELNKHGFWPDLDTLREDFGAVEAFESGPSVATLVESCLPMVRGYFLLGHQTLSVNLGIGRASSESTTWMSYSFAEATWVERTLSYERPFDGFTVAFELVPMVDFDGTSYDVSLSEMSLGGDLPAGTDMPEQFLQLRDGFVTTQINEAATLVSSVAPRGPHQGLLWLFDPAHWSAEADDAIRGATILRDALLRQATSFLLSQAYGDRQYLEGVAYLKEVSSVLAWDRRNGKNAGFWRAIEDSIRARGEAERYSVALRHKHKENAQSALDVLLQLAERGVIDVGSLIEPSPAPPAIVGKRSAAGRIDLEVWGEPITIRLRARGNRTTLDGAVAWDYAPGDADTPPMVLIVAGRGVAVYPPKDTDLPWGVDVWRVQDDALVPPIGTRIDTTAIFAPALIDNQLAVYAKRDGMYIEYVGERTKLQSDGVPTSTAEGMSPAAAIPFSVEITVDRFTGKGAFAIDVIFGEYLWGYPLGYTKPSADLVVWATKDVSIRASGVSEADPILPWLLGALDNERHDTSQGSLFRASVQAWQVELDDLELPPAWAANLPKGSRPGDRERITWGDPEQAVTATLSPLSIDEHTFYYRTHWLYDAVSVVLGLIPVVGEISDIAETAVAWTTGKDRWGRPVSKFELGLMTVCAFTPLVGTGVVRGVSEAIAARGDALVAHQSQWAGFVDRPADLLPLTPAFVRQGLVARGPFRDGVTRVDEFVDELTKFLTDHPTRLAELAKRLVDDADAEWLTLQDLLKPGGKEFAFHSLEVPFRNWQKRGHPGGTPEPFLTATSSATGEIARALLKPKGARRAPTKSSFPTREARPIGVGDNVALARGSANDILDLIWSLATEVLDGRIRMHVWDRMTMREIPDVTELTADDIVDLARQAMQRTAPGKALGDLDGNDLALLFGNATLPNEERALRVMETIFICEHDVGAAALKQLASTDAFLDSGANLIRRSGYEHSTRFEWRMADVARSLVNARLQARLPDRTGKIMQSGPDVLAYATTTSGKVVACFVQWKAFVNIESLTTGKFDFFENMGDVTKIVGPEAPRQGLNDQLRVLPWDRKVPGPGMPWPTSAAKPSDTSGWVEVGTRHVFGVDDEHVISSILGPIADAAIDRSKSIMLPSETTLPAVLHPILVKAFPPDGAVDVTDAAGARSKLRLVLKDVTAIMQNQLDEALGAGKAKSFLGRELKYLVVLASEVAADPEIITRFAMESS